MEPPVLVDSNVYIDLLRTNRDPAIELTRRVSRTDLAVCGIVRVEVLRGVKQPRVHERLRGFLDVLQNVPADERLWNEAAATAWELDRRAVVLPLQDIVIACSARRIGAEILTYDRHFRCIPGVRVRDSF